MIRASKRRTLIAASSLACAAVVAGCTTGATEPPESRNPAPPSAVGAAVLPDEVTQPLVDALPSQEGPPIALDRLAEGLVPPTTTWFSGLVFGDDPQPVFPLPHSFALADGGFSFGVPEVTSAPGVISAPHLPTVVVNAGTDSALVDAYDQVSVTLSLRAGDDERARVTIARGAAVIGYTATTEHEIVLGAAVEPAPEAGDGVYTVAAPSATHALVAPEATVSDDGMTVTLPAGATANWVAVPPDGDVAALAAHARAPIESVAVTASVGTDEVVTTLEYQTTAGDAVAIGRLPHQASDEPCDLGTFATVYGPMTLCAGPELSWSAPAVTPSAALDLSSLTADERAELVDALDSDVSTTEATPPDTYFGGKALARLAALLQLARHLAEGDGATGERAAELADTLQERLTDELSLWTEPAGCEARAQSCFVYDPVLRGIVGLEASFGADKFNDHHFHYGYFLTAAAVLAGVGSPGDERDAAVIETVRPVIDLLAADLASSGGAVFPSTRAFDPYSGHSWASGFAPFADGNNQESSSEAVNAANGLALWAEATGDEALGDQARWMLAAETLSAREYWTGFDTAVEPYAGYERGTVGIVWDGKRDFGTWFTDESAAILGIQLLPMPPVTDHLMVTPDRIEANIAEVAPDGAAQAPVFAESLLMYQSLAGHEQAAAALQAARDLPAAQIDDGVSRAYLLAFIMTRT